MGQALDREGNVLAEARGETKREVFDKLEREAPAAAEMRIRSVEESLDKIQRPSVARIVHYVAYGTPGGEFKAGAHRAAIITDVPYPHADGADAMRAHICVLNPTGFFFNQSIPYDATGQTPGSWHWPERV